MKLEAYYKRIKVMRYYGFMQFGTVNLQSFSIWIPLHRIAVNIFFLLAT